MRFSIVKKIALYLILSLILLLFTITFSIIAINDADRKMDKLRTGNLVELTASHLQTNMSSLLIHGEEYLISRDKKHFEPYKKLNDSVAYNIACLEKLPLDRKEREMLKNIKRYIDSIHHTGLLLSATLDDPSKVDYNIALIQKIGDNFNEKINNNVSALANHIHQKAELAYFTIHYERKQTFLIFIISSALTVLISIGLILLAVRHISRPILKLVGAAERIALRDFSIKLNRESEDEIGMLVVAFNAMITEINKRYEDLENFSHVVAHDLKSPLSGIIGMSDILISDFSGKMDDEGKTFLKDISLLGMRMAALITDLLNFATAGKIQFDENPVAMNKILDDTMFDLDFEIKKKNAVVNVEPGLPSVKCDSLKLQEVWKNLISNSIKYNDKEQPQIEIGMVQNNDPHNYCFFIKDNGIGIKEDSLEEIFAPFKRATTDSRFPGTGIGLAVVKRIIDFHNGKIWAESVPGNGTAFYFTIPKFMLLTGGNKA